MDERTGSRERTGTPARGPSSVRPFATALVVAFALLSAARAQIAPSGQVAITLGASAASSASASVLERPFAVATVAFEGVRVEGGTVGFSVGFVGAPLLALDLSTNRTFGPIGNVVLDARGALRSDGLGEADLSVRGVAGPVAIRVTASAFGAEAQRFRPLAVASDDRPTWTRSGVGLGIGVTGRLGRTVVLEVEPDVHFTPVGTGWRAAVALRLLRAWQQNEIRVVARGSLSPGTHAAEGAVGVGLVLPRGRAPDLAFATYLGASAKGVRPGATLDVAEDLGAGARLAVRAAYEPYRLDADPLRIATDLTLPASTFGLPSLPADARLVVSAALTLPQWGAVPRWAATTTFRWPFAGR